MSAFTKPTLPNFFNNTASERDIVRIATEISVGSNKSSGVTNPRYPAHPSIMEDGRILTDYTPKCSHNISPQLQYRTKQWMVDNTDNIIALSREKHLRQMGMPSIVAGTVPPPAVVSHASPFFNNLVQTRFAGGIGIERTKAEIRNIPGTFAVPVYSDMLTSTGVKNISMTTVQEGGRNTIRGISAIQGRRDMYKE